MRLERAAAVICVLVLAYVWREAGLHPMLIVAGWSAAAAAAVLAAGWLFRRPLRARSGRGRPADVSRPAGHTGPARWLADPEQPAGMFCKEAAGQSLRWSAAEFSYVPEPAVPVVETAPAGPDPMWDHFAAGHDLTEE